GVDRGAPSGRDTAADQDGGLQREVVIDLHAGVLGDRRIVGEGPEQAERAEVLAVLVEAEGAVRHAALRQRRTQVAEILLSPGAEPARPARGDEGAHHLVTRLDTRDAGP